MNEKNSTSGELLGVEFEYVSGVVFVETRRQSGIIWRG